MSSTSRREFLKVSAAGAAASALNAGQPVLAAGQTQDTGGGGITPTFQPAPAYSEARRFLERSRFKPTASGTRSATFILTDNAPNSPQTVPITGTGTGQNPPLTINSQFFTCTGGVCDIGANSNVFVNNFFTRSFMANGGNPPYTWSGTPPAGLALRPSGLLLGAPTATGTFTFTVTVRDSAGATASGTFSLTVTPPPLHHCRLRPAAKREGC